MAKRESTSESSKIASLGSMTIAVCPGSFDPVTLGHVDVFERAARLFDEVIACVVHNPNKQGTFAVAERRELLAESVAHLDNVRVDDFSGLLVDYCHEQGALAVVKGLRSVTDYSYEEPMAHMNWEITGAGTEGSVDTVFVSGQPGLSFVSSSLVREVAKLGGEVGHLVPPAVASAMAAKFG